MTDDDIPAIVAGLGPAVRRAVLFGRWDETPDSVSYVCPFGDLHGCYRHPKEDGLRVRQYLKGEQS